MSLNKKTTVGIIGAGTMGSGIAQIAATFGHDVHLFDAFKEQLQKSEEGLVSILNRQVEKERMTQDEVDKILSRIHFVEHMNAFETCGIIFEAIVEDLETKKDQVK